MIEELQPKDVDELIAADVRAAWQLNPSTTMVMTVDGDIYMVFLEEDGEFIVPLGEGLATLRSMKEGVEQMLTHIN